MIQIDLATRHIQYKLSLIDKFTIVRGDSATGKTSLFELIQDYVTDSTTVRCNGYKKLFAIPDSSHLDDLYSRLKKTDYVYIMDEKCAALHESGFESALSDSNNYFIIITRKSDFRNLPISRDSIVQICSSGKFHTFEPYFSESKKTEL